MRYYVNANALSCLKKFYTLSEDIKERNIMKRVKYFDEENPMKLEREINEFLSETNVSFVDIKFQSEKSSEGYGEEILHSVFLIYEEPAIGQ